MCVCVCVVCVCVSVCVCVCECGCGCVYMHVCVYACVFHTMSRFHPPGGPVEPRDSPKHSYMNVCTGMNLKSEWISIDF